MSLTKQEAEKVFMEQYYKQLIGATITEFTWVEDSGADEWSQPFPVFKAELANGLHKVTLSISCDEEGNGPGFIFIEDGCKPRCDIMSEKSEEDE